MESARRKSTHWLSLEIVFKNPNACRCLEQCVSAYYIQIAFGAILLLLSVGLSSSRSLSALQQGLQGDVHLLFSMMCLCTSGAATLMPTIE